MDLQAIADALGIMTVEELTSLQVDLETRWDKRVILHSRCSGCGGFPMGPHACPGPRRGAATTGLPMEITEFNVSLLGLRPGRAIEVLKRLRELLPGVSLIEAKKMIDSIPVVIARDVSRREAENLRDALNQIGARAEVIPLPVS